MTVFTKIEQFFCHALCKNYYTLVGVFLQKFLVFKMLRMKTKMLCVMFVPEQPVVTAGVFVVI